MFTLKDIEALAVPENSKMIIIRERHGEELPKDLKAEIAKQIKKATRLPVVFIPDGVEVKARCDE